MNKLYEKSELWFALTWIIIYILGCNFGDYMSTAIGIEKWITLIVLFIITVTMLFWISKNKLWAKYGLVFPKQKAKYYLFYIPLLVLISTNVWFGLNKNTALTSFESFSFIASMVLVGIVEELIFRGFLFKAMEKSNLTSAIIVSSLTFGIGHIINLLNGSTDLVAGLYQIVYASAVGFLFVVIFYKSQSLLPCIVTHSLVNALSIFCNMTNLQTIITSIVITLVAVGYAIFIAKVAPKTEEYEEEVETVTTTTVTTTRIRKDK